MNNNQKLIKLKINVLPHESNQTQLMTLKYTAKEITAIIYVSKRINHYVNVTDKKSVSNR